MDKQIELLNDIIFNAIKHGADPGGSYDCNEEGLVESIYSWMDFNNIEEYKIQKVRRDNWIGIIQIVNEKDNG